jgi:hypothetical protein
MDQEPTRRIARLDKQELADMPSHWTDLERGQYLSLLLHLKGIDCRRLYWVEYHPRHQCWVVSQQPEADGTYASEPAFFDHAADQLCLQTLVEFRRTARLAWAALAARSPEFARHGSDYQLPEKPEELTPGELLSLLSDSDVEPPPAEFDGEGGWHVPSPDKN